MNKKWNLKYVSLGLICILLVVLSKFPYRNYIYSNQIHDFGLADSLPSFFIIPGTLFLILSKVKNRSINILYGCTLFGLADERHQLFTTLLLMTMTWQLHLLHLQ